MRNEIQSTPTASEIYIYTLASRREKQQAPLQSRKRQTFLVASKSRSELSSETIVCVKAKKVCDYKRSELSAAGRAFARLSQCRSAMLSFLKSESIQYMHIAFSSLRFRAAMNGNKCIRDGATFLLLAAHAKAAAVCRLTQSRSTREGAACCRAQTIDCAATTRVSSSERARCNVEAFEWNWQNKINEIWKKK